MVGEAYRKAAFDQCLNTTFRVTSPQHGEVSIRLIEVRAGNISPIYDSYSLYFMGPAQKLLPQQIYELLHPRLGKLPVFIVPVGNNPSGIMYEAIFNTLK